VEVRVLIALIMANLMAVQLRHQYHCKVRLWPAVIVVLMTLGVMIVNTRTMFIVLSLWPNHCTSWLDSFNGFRAVSCCWCLG